MRYSMPKSVTLRGVGTDWRTRKYNNINGDCEIYQEIQAVYFYHGKRLNNKSHTKQNFTKNALIYMPNLLVS